MALQTTTSPALQRLLTGPVQELEASLYFRSPVWAPGARLMARLPFASKALLICLMILVPLAWVSWAYYAAQSEAIAFADKERMGVEYTSEVFPLIDLAQQMRHDVTATAISGSAPASMAEVRSR